jgi:hypothetical protein
MKMRLQLREEMFGDFAIVDIDTGVTMISMKFEELAFSQVHKRVVAERAFHALQLIAETRVDRRTPDIITIQGFKE